MYLKFAAFLILATCLVSGFATRCKLSDDLAEIHRLDADFWESLDASIINAAIFNWSNQTIFDTFKNVVLLPHVIPNFTFSTLEPTGLRVLSGVDEFANFAVDSYARGLRGEFHVSSTLGVSCLSRDKYLVEKFDVEIVKTVARSLNIYGRKRQVFVVTDDGIKIESISITVHAFVVLPDATFLPFF